MLLRSRMFVNHTAIMKVLFSVPPKPKFSWIILRSSAKAEVAWNEFELVALCTIILRLGTNDLLNYPRTFAFAGFLPASCCILPPLWDPLGLNISAQIKRVNLAAKQSRPIFTEMFILVHCASRNVISKVKIPPKLQRTVPFLEREEALCFSFVILLFPAFKGVS